MDKASILSHHDLTARTSPGGVDNFMLHTRVLMLLALQLSADYATASLEAIKPGTNRVEVAA